MIKAGDMIKNLRSVYKPVDIAFVYDVSEKYAHVLFLRAPWWFKGRRDMIHLNDVRRFYHIYESPE